MSSNIAGAFRADSKFPAAIEALLTELKTRARLRLNALDNNDPAIVNYALWLCKKRRWLVPTEWKLQHAFNIVASEIGFRDWEQARHVLSGNANRGDDMGGFWHSFRCELLLNHWFAHYDAAKEWQRDGNERWLFPYARQFVVVDRNYVTTLMLDPELPQWSEVDRDLFANYATEAWLSLCAARIHATRGLPPPIPGRF